jgi:hypothetical protein
MIVFFGPIRNRFISDPGSKFDLMGRVWIWMGSAQQDHLSTLLKYDFWPFNKPGRRRGERRYEHAFYDEDVCITLIAVNRGDHGS